MQRNLRLPALLAGLVLLILAICAIAFLLNRTPSATTVRPESTEKTVARKDEWPWARKLTRPGLANLHQLSADLYRGAQPDPKETGFAELKKLGVKTIINLRSLHGESDEVDEAGLQYEHIFFNPLLAPDDKEVLAFLRIATDTGRTPVFVHCKHGADRTGTMCAAYRVVVQGWPKEEAVREMKDGGFNFHAKYYESYAKYILNLDVEKVRRALPKPVGD